MRITKLMFLTTILFSVFSTTTYAELNLIDENITCVKGGRWTQGNEVIKYNNIGEGTILIETYSAFGDEDTLYTKRGSGSFFNINEIPIKDGVIFFRKNLRLDLNKLERISTTSVTAPYRNAGSVTRTTKHKCIRDLSGDISQMTKGELIDLVR